jgi:hypothetical protein
MRRNVLQRKNLNWNRMKTIYIYIYHVFLLIFFPVSLTELDARIKFKCLLESQETIKQHNFS